MSGRSRAADKKSDRLAHVVPPLFKVRPSPRSTGSEHQVEQHACAGHRIVKKQFSALDFLANAQTPGYDRLVTNFQSTQPNGVKATVRPSGTPTAPGESNVDLADEAVSMIETSVAYKANASVFEAGADMWEALSTMVRDHDGEKKVVLAGKEPVERLLRYATTACDNIRRGADQTEFGKRLARCDDDRLKSILIALCLRTPTTAFDVLDDGFFMLVHAMPRVSTSVDIQLYRMLLYDACTKKRKIIPS